MPSIMAEGRMGQVAYFMASQKAGRNLGQDMPFTDTWPMSLTQAHLLIAHQLQTYLWIYLLSRSGSQPLDSTPFNTATSCNRTLSTVAM